MCVCGCVRERELKLKAYYETIEAQFYPVLYPSDLCIVGVLIEGVHQQSGKERCQECGGGVLVGQGTASVCVCVRVCVCVSRRT